MRPSSWEVKARLSQRFHNATWWVDIVLAEAHTGDMTTTQTLHEHAVEVDTRIAETFRTWMVAQARSDSERLSIRYAAGQRTVGYGRDQHWNGSYEEAFAACETIAARTPVTYIEIKAQEALDDVIEASRIEHEAFTAYVEAETEYEGWSRFFMVIGGHIHSSRNCSTCYPTTAFGWLPQLSGLTEDDAVAEYGSVLCSICYPSAPVDHVGGISDGLTLVERAARKAEKDAEKAARDAKKAAKTLNPEDVFRDWNWKVETVAAAKVALREAAVLIAGYSYESKRSEAPRIREDARKALSAKGVTEDELNTIEARAIKAYQKRGY